MGECMFMELIRKVRNVSGDFAEVGVWKGRTFKRLVREAIRMHRTAHAFDSFTGMDEPGEHDKGQYPKGILSVGGVKAFKSIMTEAGIGTFAADWMVWEGYIPHGFMKYDKIIAKDFAFALIDVDHYLPTKVAAEWVHHHLHVGSILVFDDWFPDKDELASKAIQEFLDARGWMYKTVAHENDQLALVRLQK